jgi:hypothetical protein
LKVFITKFSVFSIVFLFTIYLRLYLSLFGFRKLINFITKPRTNFLDIANLKYVSRSIGLASLFLPNISCLIRAAVLKIIFNETEKLKIIIGINTTEERLFVSHAWVTLDDAVILNSDPQINFYKVIYTI